MEQDSRYLTDLEWRSYDLTYRFNLLHSPATRKTGKPEVLPGTGCRIRGKAILRVWAACRECRRGRGLANRREPCLPRKTGISIPDQERCFGSGLVPSLCRPLHASGHGNLCVTRLIYTPMASENRRPSRRTGGKWSA